VASNLDFVRSIYAGWERGDFSSTEWVDPEIEYVIADGPAPGAWRGLAGMAEGTRDIVSPWEGFHTQAEAFRELDDERVLVLTQMGGRAKASGVELAQVRSNGAMLWHLRGGKVVRLVNYWDRDRALADLGMAPEARGSSRRPLVQRWGWGTESRASPLRRSSMDTAPQCPRRTWS
jgi:ketosteroid isomerase-like protein